MKKAWTGIAAATLTASVNSAGFGADPVGAVPSGWTCGVTGRGQPRWTIATEPQAPSRSGKVLLQDGTGTFPWCVKVGTSLADGFVEVKFKPISGREDQAGGVVWRWKDGDHYYVARANALENNVSLYYTEKGSRKTLMYVDAPVSVRVWHTLRSAHITVSLDGKRYIEVDDTHVTGAGAVGVWTKADSVTAFDDFAAGPAAR